MTTNVIVIAPSLPFREIVRTFLEGGIEAAPVIDASGRLVGLVSATDLLPKEQPSTLLRHHLFEGRGRRQIRRRASGLTAVDVMSTPALTISPRARLKTAAAMLIERGVNQLPVIDESEQLVGLVRRSEVLKVFLRDPAAIRDEINTRVIQRHLGVDACDVDATVDSGIATLQGRVARRSDAETLVAAVRDVDGVVAVTDKLTYWWDDVNAGPLEQALMTTSASSRDTGPVEQLTSLSTGRELG